MPQLTAATWVRIGSALIALAASNLSTAMRSATQAPEIAAVRVPPSAWMTSQSTMIWRSPSALQVDHGAQRAADQPLDFLGAARLLALGRLAVAARVGGARQHAIFGGDPALALAAQERRHLVLDRGGDQHARVAEADQAGAFGMAGEAGFEAKLAHLVGGASGLGRIRASPDTGAGAP